LLDYFSELYLPVVASEDIAEDKDSAAGNSLVGDKDTVEGNSLVEDWAFLPVAAVEDTDPVVDTRLLLTAVAHKDLVEDTYNDSY
jgi:hypothetical protein